MLMRFFVTIILIALVIFFGVLIFGHHPQNGSTKPITTTKSLADYSNTNADVKLTIDGIINGDDVHRQIQVTVSSTARTLDIIGGYNGNVIRSKLYVNNPTAFQTFLKALQLNGFNKTRKTTITDDQGFCAQGQRYIYQLENTGTASKDFRLWGSSCGGGTSGGLGQNLRDLFSNQISDYDALTNDVSI